MTPPQIRYTPENYDDNGKKNSIWSCISAVSAYQKLLFSISTSVYWRVINFTFKISKKTANSLIWRIFQKRHVSVVPPPTSRKPFSLSLVLPITHKFPAWILATIARKQKHNQPNHYKFGRQSFCCFHQLPASAASASFYPSGHLYGCKAKVGPWISTAFGQSHGQLRMCSRGFGDHRGTWRFLVGGLKVWKIMLVFLCFLHGMIRVGPVVFPKFWTTWRKVDF